MGSHGGRMPPLRLHDNARRCRRVPANGKPDVQRVHSVGQRRPGPASASGARTPPVEAAPRGWRCRGGGRGPAAHCARRARTRSSASRHLPSHRARGRERTGSPAHRRARWWATTGIRTLEPIGNVSPYHSVSAAVTRTSIAAAGHSRTLSSRQAHRRRGRRGRRPYPGGGLLRRADLGEGALVRGRIGREQGQRGEDRGPNRVERHQPERHLAVRISPPSLVLLWPRGKIPLKSAAMSMPCANLPIHHIDRPAPCKIAEGRRCCPRQIARTRAAKARRSA